MAELDLKKVVCISLKSHNEDQLNAIAATVNISLQDLLKAKADGCKKIWVHQGGGIVVAGLDTDNPDDVYFSDEYLPLTAKMRKAILAIKPMKTPKMPKMVGDVVKKHDAGLNGLAPTEDAIPEHT